MADVSKQDVADAVADADRIEQSKGRNKAVDAVIDCIKGSLANGKSVGLNRFWYF